MAFKSYHAMNGQIIGDSDADYILDGLGSVIGTWRSTGTIQNQYRYSGYGQLVHKSGTGADPYFLCVGGWGYRTRGMVYVRRRTYYEKAAVWTSVDPLWPDESAYGYGNANPLSYIDWGGSSPQKQTIIESITGVPDYEGMRKCLPGDKPGHTNCNLTGMPAGTMGTVWVKICSTRCAFNCTVLHENVHVKQVTECCKRAGKCVSSKLGIIDKSICRNKFKDWMLENTDAFECEAYTASCDCFQRAIRTIPSYDPMICCVPQWRTELEMDCSAKKKHCEAKKRITPCPFDSDGGYSGGGK